MRWWWTSRLMGGGCTAQGGGRGHQEGRQGLRVVIVANHQQCPWPCFCQEMNSLSAAVVGTFAVRSSSSDQLSQHYVVIIMLNNVIIIITLDSKFKKRQTNSGIPLFGMYSVRRNFCKSHPDIPLFATSPLKVWLFGNDGASDHHHHHHHHHHSKEMMAHQTT